MKEFDKTITGLPYLEGPGYVKELVERCSENASAQSVRANRFARPWIYAVSGIAAAAVLVCALTFSLHRNALSPMDAFLASLTDTEVSMIDELPIEEIPEYYYQ
ncbi:MAG: hypothetical protein IJM35_06335 [Bacteroidales bacterium]|nr:hypothetical protein [Bacteroidales bacterium]